MALQVFENALGYSVFFPSSRLFFKSEEREDALINKQKPIYILAEAK